MAAGIATVEAYQEDNLIENSAKLGDYLLEKAKELMDRHPCIGDVRGKGLFVGVELVKNRKTKEPIHDPYIEGLRPPTAKVKVLAEAMKNGVYCLPGIASVLMLAPPLCVTKDQIDFAIEVFDKALVIADAEVE
jgi:taurine--2-oxoglutarate transaminase